MKTTQVFNIHPNGNVRGKSLVYAHDALVDSLNMGIDYSVTVAIKGAFGLVGTKTFAGKVVLKTDDMLSKSYIVGHVANFGPLTLEVKTVSPGHAYASLVLNVPGGEVTGKGMVALDTTGPWVKFGKMADGFYGRADVFKGGTRYSVALELP